MTRLHEGSSAVDPTIRDVSDTALWVATFRAREGERADAAFADPLALPLAGERGRAIARALPRAAMVEWGMIMRTWAIDRLIDAAVVAGVDAVVNLGAGLDTRPYRMTLPASLRWVEADFPRIIDLKNGLLEGRQPACHVERVAIDLLDHPSRHAFFTQYAASSANVLVITEGVLPYFPAAEVARLAGDLRGIASIRLWIQDFDNAGKRQLPRGWAEKLRAAPLTFTPANWFGFFEKYGWRPSQVITNFDAAEKIGRPYPFDFPAGLILRVLPRVMRQRILSLTGAVLMDRAP